MIWDIHARTATVLVVLICNRSAVADETSNVSVPTWSVSPSAEPRLAEEVDGDWFSIRPPKGYDRVELGDTTAYDQAGIKIAAWTKKTDQPFNPTITVMSLPAPRTAPQNNHEFFQGILDSLTAKWPNAKGSKITEGLWNGRRALRFQFSATDDKGDHIRGVVVCDISDSSTFVVSIANAGDTNEDKNELAALTSSAISCKQKTPPAP